MREEEKWLRQAKKGDREAFGLIYQKYSQKIFAFIYWQVLHREKAEELTQEVFLKAWQYLEKYQKRKNCSFSSWLYRIARNTVIDFYRTEKRVYSFEEEIFSFEEKIFSQDKEDPEKIAEGKIELERAKKIIASLPEGQREVIILKFIEGLSNKEIARILKKSEGAIRILQYRAVKNLKKLL